MSGKPRPERDYFSLTLAIVLVVAVLVLDRAWRYLEGLL